MEGTENSDEIIAAITTYRAKHTAEQTERVVRIWYEHYDEIRRQRSRTISKPEFFATRTPTMDTNCAWRAGTISRVMTGK